jgi:peroxiredoxin (alkyl hydroperoxide reductase subunit C)
MTETTTAGGIPRIGDVAPDFKAITTQGEIQFSQWQGGKWVILFSHPADFTPVCSTELTEFAKRSKEFEALDCKLIGLSVDSIHSHLAWRENLRHILDAHIDYPMIADIDMKVSSLYGMLHPGASATATVRSVFLIDPKRVVRALVYYPMNVGRNVDEIVRVLTALQTADANACATPVNWRPGEDVIVPPPKTEADVKQRETVKDATQRHDFYLIKKKLAAKA